MVAFKFLALALGVCGVMAEQEQPFRPPGMSQREWDELRAPKSAQPEAANLAVEVTTAFPDAEVFGVKMVNGKPTKARIHMLNLEEEDIHLRLLQGGLFTPRDVPKPVFPPLPLANLTTKGFNMRIRPGKTETAVYHFTADIAPQDVNLIINAVWQGPAGQLVQKTVYNGTVATVDPPMSMFDPQIIFLYFFLALAFGGTCWFIYSTWIAAFFPQKKRGGKGGERTKRTPGKSADAASPVGSDGAAVATGASAYDESWIPAEHLKRPEARRVGSGRPKSRAA